ncbi:MAG: DUF2474 domain-containing protein [Betaproteobacteria bacterium]|nr:MAG: DUF2474 domain-containing protein [Betaproteobacteria bacterium]
MRDEHETRGAVRSPPWRRLAWFVGIWAGGVLALGAFAWLLRLLMRAIGMGA